MPQCFEHAKLSKVVFDNYGRDHIGSFHALKPHPKILLFMDSTAGGVPFGWVSVAFHHLQSLVPQHFRYLG